jgi:arylsulfatase A-like enzyme
MGAERIRCRSRRAVAGGMLGLAALSIGCADRSRRVVRLPVPEPEWVGVAAETRPGVWLSPGDAVRWTLPAGPRRRLSGAYASLLVGDPAGRLDIGVSGDELSGAGPAAPPTLAISPDPSRWHSFVVELPAAGAPVELALSYVNDGPGSGTRSLFLAEPSLAVRAGEPPRTIILLVVDTLRADRVGAYGYRRATTPRLDHFFRQGLRAEKGVAASNWTLPAHASLFTSVPVARHDAGRYGNLLAESFQTLAEQMSGAGFRTLAVTGGGLIDPAFGMAQGFDRYFTANEPAAQAVERALGLLREHRDEPVFLFLHTYQVHDYAADEASARELFGGVAALGPDWRAGFSEIARARGQDPALAGWLRNRYDAALRSVDSAFGRLLAGLQREERLSRTAILFTSDHGEALCDREIWGRCLSWGHGSPYLYEEELLVPLELRIPWMPRVRGLARGNASHLDVAPTLLEAAGVPVPPAWEGRSLLSAPPPPGRPIVSEASPLESLAVRIDDHKLIRRTGVSQSFWSAAEPFLALSVQESFDLSRDPGEGTPLASASDWGRRLLEEVDRYLAAGFPDSLVVRLPAVPAEAGRPIVVSARGRAGAPALRSFGLGSRGVFSQRGAVTEARFRTPRAPVWLAFAADDSRALALRIDGAGPVAFGSGGSLDAGSYAWNDLGWAAREPLPSGVAVFTTPPSSRRPGAQLPLPGDVVARLLSLGYLPFTSSSSALPAAPATELPDTSLAPGEVRIRHAN